MTLDRETPLLDTGQLDPEAFIHALAQKHQVTYKQTATDILAGHFTRLSGDEVELDETQLLLLALRRAGYINGFDAMRIQAAYLRRGKH